MISCGDCQKWMLEALYGELDSADRMALDQHIAACSECAAELAGLERTRQDMDIRKQVPPSEETLENVWPEFLNRLGQSESPRAGILHWTTRRWALNLAAAAALVAIGVIIGRYGRLAPRPDSTGPGVKESPAVAASALDDRVARYLERSKLVLMSVDNMKPGAGDATALDLGPERRLSKDLLRESRALEEGTPGVARGPVAGVDLAARSDSPADRQLARSPDSARCRAGQDRNRGAGVIVQNQSRGNATRERTDSKVQT